MDSFYAEGKGEKNVGYTRVKCMRTLQNCDEFLISNEEGLPLRVAQIPGTLNNFPFFYYTILFSLSNALTLQSLEITNNPIIIL